MRGAHFNPDYAVDTYCIIWVKSRNEILGYKDIKKTMRYAHLPKGFAKKEIQLMNGLTSRKEGVNEKNSVTKVAQIEDPICCYLPESLSVVVELRGLEPLTS
jgi:hypothetical protein